MTVVDTKTIKMESTTIKGRSQQRPCEVQLLIVKESKTFKKLLIEVEKTQKTCEKTMKEELIKEDVIIM